MKRSPHRASVFSIRRMSIMSLPMPMIRDMTRASGPGSAAVVHQAAHLADGWLKTGENCLANQEMTDVELDNRRDCGNWRDRVIGETVAGVAFKAQFLGKHRRLLDPLQLTGARRRIERIAIGAGMDLDDIGADLLRSLKLARLGLDEQRNADAGALQALDIVTQAVMTARDIEAAFCRPLRPLFRDEATRIGFMRERDGQHLLGCGDFQIERNGQLL